jgi:hypothetical protein
MPAEVSFMAGSLQAGTSIDMILLSAVRLNNPFFFSSAACMGVCFTAMADLPLHSASAIIYAGLTSP